MATTVGSHPLSAFTVPVNGTSPIDANEVRGNDSTIRTAYNAHDADTGIHVQSSEFGSRPSAGTSGRKWMTVDALSAPTEVFVWYDDGTNWYEIDYLRSSGGALSGALTITSTTTPQLSVQYDASNELDISVSSAGAVTYNATGASAGHTFSEAVTVAAGGLTVSAGGAAITGNSTVTGTLTVSSTLTQNGTTANLVQSASSGAVFVGTGTGSGSSAVAIQSAAGQSAYVQMSTASSARWLISKNTTAESGSNAGSNLVINAYSDAGVSIDAPVTIVRAAGGAITLARPTTISSALAVSSGGIAVTGNSTITGTLGGLTGLTVASGGATVTGNVTLNNNLTVTESITCGTLLGVTATSGPQLTVRYDASNRLDVQVTSVGLVAFDAVGSGALFRFNGQLTVRNTAPSQFLVEYDASNRLDVTVSSAGAVTLTAVGGGAGFTCSHALSAPGLTSTSGVTVNGLVDVTGSIFATGALTIEGNTTLGNATTDTLTVTARLASSLVPSTSLSRDLGSSTLLFNASYVGTQYLGADAQATDTYVRTSSVSSATTIATLAQLATTPYYVIVTGRDTPAGTAEFVDVVAVGGGSATVVTISGTTLEGSPASRTYTISGSNLQLAMASDTYNVGARIFSLPRV